MNKKEFLFPFDFYFSSNREKERTNKQMFMYNYFLHFILTGFKSGSIAQYIALFMICSTKNIVPCRCYA